ncbi:hypothetical protein Moror_5754 [Moniliophthora roreri MCA 2997]|uniref:Uncharacterized protein n=1 Tax=Moniliophthora roreri (strain MCA 2997) TaxID=1381753 RepID=V2X0F1_MONRO|nr:hypothetical protein Moror_5754 [Moniliophthora roreri MCA 2997]
MSKRPASRSPSPARQKQRTEVEGASRGFLSRFNFLSASSASCGTQNDETSSSSGKVNGFSAPWAFEDDKLTSQSPEALIQSNVLALKYVNEARSTLNEVEREKAELGRMRSEKQSLAEEVERLSVKVDLLQASEKPELEALRKGMAELRGEHTRSMADLKTNVLDSFGEIQKLREEVRGANNLSTQSLGIVRLLSQELRAELRSLHSQISGSSSSTGSVFPPWSASASGENGAVGLSSRVASRNLASNKTGTGGALATLTSASKGVASKKNTDAGIGTLRPPTTHSTPNTSNVTSPPELSAALGEASISHERNTISTQRAFEDISPSQFPETLELRIVALRYLDNQRNEKQADLARLTQRIEESHAVLIGVKRDPEEQSAKLGEARPALGEAEQAKVDTSRLKVDLRHLHKEREQERSRMRADIQTFAAEVEGEQQNVRVSRSRSRG